MAISCNLITCGAKAGDRHAHVAGFERFHADTRGNDLIAGRLLLGELNCTSCHAAPDTLGISNKSAPKLDGVGSRVRADFLRRFLTDPSGTKPGTTMPDVLHGIPADLRGQQVDELVHFLASTGEIHESAPIASSVRHGEQLFHRVGCVACHDPRHSEARPMSNSVPFPDLAAKYSIPGLARFLQEPLDIRKAGRMPDLNLDEKEARDIACYLLRELKIPASMTFTYFEGSWEKLPEFASLKPTDTGPAANFDVNVGRKDNFAIRFEGVFRTERDGEYRFHVTSDDGSRLYVDGRLVVGNDGIHALKQETGRLQLARGNHRIAADYFEQGGEESLTIEIEGPDGKRAPLESVMVAPAGHSLPPPLQVNPSMAERGREVFIRAGCVSCHEIPGAAESLRAMAKSLSELNPTTGCLSENPPAGLPEYELSSGQRRALDEILRGLGAGTVGALSDQEHLQFTMTRLNCFACHSRNGMGGVEAERNRFFETNQPEMGDEGRIPPQLDNVGDKLQQKFLRQIFDRGAKDRPYMFTRMPRFGAENTRTLAGEFGLADRPAGLAAEPELTFDRKIKSVGRQLVGDKGLSCIKCHTWGDSKATGIQAISLTSMTRRLNPDWFERYLIDPQKYRPGTRMPAAWPNGQSPFAKILDGDAHLQIDSIWAYLEDAESANPPIGLISNPIELIASTEPVIYRNFLQGSGARSIGVGYPEKVNMAFDAEHCRLAMLWQGAFIDASMHWVGRGSGFQQPLGDNLLTFQEGLPFAVLDSPNQSWPAASGRKAGYQFRGYQLDTRRQPQFLYDWNGLRVTDRFEPVTTAKGPELHRTMRLEGIPPSGSYFRALVAEQIKAAGNRHYQIDNDWTILIESPSEPIVRSAGGKHELLLPLVASSDKPSETVIVQRIAW